MACCGSCVHLYQGPHTSSHHLLEEGCCTDGLAPEHLDHKLRCKLAIQANQKIHRALQWEKRCSVCNVLVLITLFETAK